MQKIKSAFRFIRSSYQLAYKHDILQKSLTHMAAGGAILLLIWLIPLILVVRLIGLSPVGLFLVGLLIMIGLISLLVWGNIISNEISKTFDILIQESDLFYDFEEQNRWLTDRALEGALFFLALPGEYLIAGIQRMFRSPVGQEIRWVEGSYLALPVMVNEKLSLDETMQRVKQLLGQNRARFQPGLIPVEWIGQIIQWILIMLGLLIGFIVGKNIANPLDASFLMLVLAMLIGSLIAAAFMVIGIHFKSFTRTCYHTALYRWVRNVESASLSANPEQAKPPTILRQILGRGFVKIKES